MLIIHKKQIEKLDELEKEKFIKRSVVFLKANYADWSSDKSDSEIMSFIFSIINFGTQFDLKKERIYIELMILEIEKSMFKYFPFPKVNMKLLKNKKRDEYFKINMISDLVIARYKEESDE